jgi:hypothetical protein
LEDIHLQSMAMEEFLDQGLAMGQLLVHLLGEFHLQMGEEDFHYQYLPKFL